MRNIETAVLIVGGGPVGLSTSLELASRGVKCTLVERTDGVVRNSKMGAVSVRSMETLRRWGLAERVRKGGFPEDYELSIAFCTSMAGYSLAKTPYPSMGEEPVLPQSPERRQRIPQLWFDPILSEAVRSQPSVDVRTHTEIISFTQDAQRVLAQVRDLASGETYTIEAQYLVACDGSGSSLRKSMGIEMLGDAVLSYSTGVYLRSPNLLARHDKGQAERYMLVGSEGTWGNLTVVDGDTYWRLTVIGPRSRVEAEDFDADYWVKRCFGTDAIPYEIDAVLPWRRSRLVAERYSLGRVFLAGDSAHVMAPNGGHGMNTGIGDAVNIGWKLNAVLDGWGGQGLLDSYNTERQPIGQRNVNAAASSFAATVPDLDFSHIEEATPQGDAARRELGEQLEASMRQEWEALGIILGYTYLGSPIVVPDSGTPPPDDHSHYDQSAFPGCRAPHAWLAPGQSTLDLFGEGYTLLRFGATSPGAEAMEAAAAKRGVPLKVQTIEDPSIAALYERSLVLVRPDGHVAWRGDAGLGLPESLDIIDTVRGSAHPETMRTTDETPRAIDDSERFRENAR